MNLKQLQQFIALAETGNFHRAAEQLHMAQPPLSISIRKLEEDLGTRLLHRTTRKVSLTEDGQKTLPLARKIAGDLDDFYELFKNHQNVLRLPLKTGVLNPC